MGDQLDHDVLATLTMHIPRHSSGTVNRERASLLTVANSVLLLEAAFDRHVYKRHMHDTYAAGVTLRGVQQFWCRGSIYRSTAHHAIVIPPERSTTASRAPQADTPIECSTFPSMS
jgi:AraC-like ligand binding domain